MSLKLENYVSWKFCRCPDDWREKVAFRGQRLEVWWAVFPYHFPSIWKCNVILHCLWGEEGNLSDEYAPDFVIVERGEWIIGGSRRELLKYQSISWNGHRDTDFRSLECYPRWVLYGLASLQVWCNLPVVIGAETPIKRLIYRKDICLNVDIVSRTWQKL